MHTLQGFKIMTHHMPQISLLNQRRPHVISMGNRLKENGDYRDGDGSEKQVWASGATLQHGFSILQRELEGRF